EISVVRRGRVRRAKLYYLRNLTGKATRIREKKVRVFVPETGVAEQSPARRMARDRWKPVERELRRTVGPLIAGVDEVGRGPLAGPVVACAVVMPPDVRAISGVDDSKRLTAAARVRLARKIRERALSVGVGAASVREIDRVNIYHATVLAMRRALSRLSMTPHH